MARNKTTLKWAGNKSRAKDVILPLLGKGKRLIEPFSGSCAISLESDFSEFVLCDINPDLISFHQHTIHCPDFMTICRSMFQPSENTEERYYKNRAEFNSIPQGSRKAALFLYLNRHGFNGICRYNPNSGNFTTPYARPKAPYFPEQEMLAFKEKFNRSLFLCADFSVAIAEAKEGDVVYCDPPYSPFREGIKTMSYSKGQFSDGDHERLVEEAEAARRRGARVLISNHDTPYSRSIYRSASELIEHDVRRAISCKADGRVKMKELVAVYA